MESEERDKIIQALLSQVETYAREEGFNATVIPELVFYRRSKPVDASMVFSLPCIVVILQGHRTVKWGDDELFCDSEKYLLASVTGLPVRISVQDVSPETPYLALRLQLDLQTIRQLLIDQERVLSSLKPVSVRGITTGKTTVELLHALQRLLSLLDRPEDIPALYGGIKYEIIYRLLTSELGGYLREMAVTGTHGNRIAKAVDWIRKNYRQPLKVEELASEVGMGISTLYHHFHEVTAMSPLQYQKMLRLTEARRLMLEENCDAGGAAFQVGYESQSQFSREYRRLFGTPPLRDIKTLLKH